MSEIYFNRKGITHQVELLVFEAGDDTIIWEAKVDGDSFYFETATSFEVADVIELAQKTYNDVLDSEEKPVKAEVTEENDFLDFEDEKWLSLMSDLSKTANLSGATEAADYWAGLVSSFVHDLGFGEDEDIIGVSIVNNKIVVWYINPDDGKVSYDEFNFGGK